MTNRILLLKKIACAAGVALLMAGSANADVVINFTNVDPDTGTVDGGGTLVANQMLGDGDAFTTLSYTVSGLTIDADGTANDEITVTMDLAGFDTDGAAVLNWDVIEIDLDNNTFRDPGDGISFGAIGVTGILSGGDALVVNSANYTGLAFRRWAAAVDETVNVDGDVTDIPLNTVNPVTLNDTAFSVTHVSGGSWQVNDFNFAVDVSAVPEPSSLALVAAGFGMIGLRRRRLK